MAVDTANGGVNVNGTLFVVGVATRADVATNLGPGTADGDNDFWANYCNLGIQVQFVDDVDNNDNFLGVPDGNDVVARVIVLPEADASTSEGVSIGQPLSETETELPGAASIARPFGTMLVLPSSGLMVEHNIGGRVHTLSIARPLAANAWDTRIALSQRRLGPMGAEFRVGNDDFDQLATLIGEGWDVEGAFPVEGQNDGWLRIWATVGVRAAAAPGLFNDADSGDNIATLFLSPPFLGRDDNGVGLGSTRAELEAVLGTSSGMDSGLELYDCNAESVGNIDLNYCVGVSFEAAGGTCEERVQALVLDYIQLL